LIHRLAPAVLLVAAVVPAQEFTSPAGLLTTEGGSNHNYILFARPGMRWQQIDSTSVGTAYTDIKQISWRRDAGAANSSYVARTIDLSVLMAHSDVKNVSLNYDNNYLAPATTVFTTKTVNLPDWTAAGSGTGPEPWSIAAPFDTKWSYNGTDHLLWEVRYSSNSAVPAGTASANYGNDFQETTGVFSTSTSGSLLGTGCVATGRTSTMSLTGTFYNHGSKFRFTQAVSNAPSNAAVFDNLDLSDPNLPLPGLCQPVRAAPTIVSLPLGTSSATGSVSAVTFDNIPYSSGLVGVDLFFQALALDTGLPGIPVALSNGRRYTVPANPSLPAVARVYQYPLSSGTLTNSGPWTGGIVAKFDY
jgi:hypothetical protein